MCSVSVTCPLCAQTSFPSIDSLRISLIKAANGPLTCPICREILLGLDKLTIHLFSHTNLIEQSDCSVNYPNLIAIKTEQSVQEEKCISHVNAHVSCPDGPSPNSIASHELFVDQPKCDICGLAFHTSDLLHMHNRLVHHRTEDSTSSTLSASNDARYQCHLCAKVFKMKGSLRVHLKVVHLLGLPTVHNTIPKLGICEKIKQRNSNSQLISGVVIPSASQHTIPESQPHPFCTNNEPQEATKNSTEDSDTVGSMDKKLQNDSPKSNESAKIWECDICSKSFTTKYFLKKHKRLHTGEMPYTCEICGKTFTFQQSYHKHLLYHSDEKPHACQTCGRAFKELSTLHNHERIHSGEKPFKCETCGKCFRQRVSYLVHKRIHTGAMPYNCNACHKSFRYKVSQRTHKCFAQSLEGNPSPSEDILQKLLHSTSILQEDNNNSTESTDGLPTLSSKSTPKHEFNEEMLTKSIDDIVAESCTKMGIGSNGTVDQNLPINNDQERIASPSEGFQNLCLYSPSNDPLTTNLEAISEDHFKQFLYGVEEHL